jgi:hypothetical protein
MFQYKKAAATVQVDSRSIIGSRSRRRLTGEGYRLRRLFEHTARVARMIRSIKAADGSL